MSGKQFSQSYLQLWFGEVQPLAPGCCRTLLIVWREKTAAPPYGAHWDNRARWRMDVFIGPAKIWFAPPHDKKLAKFNTLRKQSNCKINMV